MNARERCTCGDSACPSCGTAQGTYDDTLCACGCGRPLGDDECANDRGEPSGVHADCWAAWVSSQASIAEDRAVDRAQEREMFRDWGAKS